VGSEGKKLSARQNVVNLNWSYGLPFPQGVEAPAADLLASCGWGPSPETLGIPETAQAVTPQERFPQLLPCDHSQDAVSPPASHLDVLRERPAGEMHACERERSSQGGACQGQAQPDSRGTCGEMRGARNDEDGGGELNPGPTDLLDSQSSPTGDRTACCGDRAGYAHKSGRVALLRVPSPNDGDDCGVMTVSDLPPVVSHI
jgi:hypothetical protein